jgi:hypothetical protein
MIAVHRRDLPRATSRRLAVISMPDEEPWLTRDAALERLRRILKLSIGAAEAAFDEAMSSGTIRSRSFTVILSEPNLERLVFEDRLGPEAWQRGDHRSINGEVSSDDLEFWIAKKLALQSSDARFTGTAPLPTAEEACAALIVTWLKEEPGLTKTEVSSKSHKAIRDLQSKEFERAWRGVPQELKNPPGRPSSRN